MSPKMLGFVWKILLVQWMITGISSLVWKPPTSQPCFIKPALTDTSHIAGTGCVHKKPRHNDARCRNIWVCVKTYYYQFYWGEHPFTSFFDVHWGYKVLTQSHIINIVAPEMSAIYRQWSRNIILIVVHCHYSTMLLIPNGIS